MVSFRQVFSSLLSSRLPIHDTAQSHDPKSIAIVGAGSAGLAMLKTLIDVSDSTTSEWNFVLFEQRSNLGGVWLPDPNPARPPIIPETPLYPLLHTNTPVPSMTYSGFPFPPGTPLYPSREYVEAYHQKYASRFNMTQHIRLNHEVLKTLWIGNTDKGQWDITYRDDNGKKRRESFRHLIVATGNNHLPRILKWPGEREWLENTPSGGPKREIQHTVWYREPQRYAGRCVLIIGNGSSGRDAALHITPLAKETFVSVRHEPDSKQGAIPEGAQLKPEISHFTQDAVVYKDGTTSSVDSVLLATGYEIRKPFLDEGNVLVTDRSARSRNSHTNTLVTNTRYIFPLHQHILSLSPSYPLNALAFIGLPSAIANCPSDIAQSLYVAHAILNPNIFASREELLKDLAGHEDRLRSYGYDPYSIGHQLLPGTSSDYQDLLVKYLKDKGAIPNDGNKFVESWRRDILTYGYLKRGWKRIEYFGMQREWLDGVETETQWAHLMSRINQWQENWEKKQNISFVPDWDLAG